MNKKKLLVSIVMGTVLAKGVFAGDPKTDKEELDIQSIVYIEEPIAIELGFDTADYLPEGFDPYRPYFDINKVLFLEDFDLDSTVYHRYLPKGFDAHAFPQDVQSINYIDERDAIETDFDTIPYLPEGFDAYRRE